MIQRLQSLWLLLASASSFITLKLSFFSGNKLIDSQRIFMHLNAITSNNLILLILTVAVGLAALFSIFLYKNRKMQLTFIIFTLLIAVLNIVLFFLEARKFMPEEGNYDITSVFVFATPIFLLLAIRGIYKDEKLIKSLDRLR